MVNPVIYVLLNGELKMSPGKAAAQAVHAVASLHNLSGIAKFSKETKRTVIILEANSTQQLNNLEDYLFQLDVKCASYIDEGHNEVEPYSVTALAIGPIAADDLSAREILRGFPLYPRKRGLFR